MRNYSQRPNTSYKWLDEYISEYPFSYIFIETLFYDIPECFRNYAEQWNITEQEIKKFYNGTEDGTLPATSEELLRQSTIEAIQKFSTLFQNRLKHCQKDTDQYKRTLKETIAWLDKGVLLNDAKSIYERAFYFDDTQSGIINKYIQNSLLGRAVRLGYERAIKSFIEESSIWRDTMYALDIAPEHSHLILNVATQKYKDLLKTAQTFSISSVETHLVLMEAGVSGSNTPEAKNLLMEDLMKIIFCINENFYRKCALSQKPDQELPITRKSIYTLLGLAYYSKYGASPEDHATALEYGKKAKNSDADFADVFKDSPLPPEKLNEIKKLLDESGLF